jgi:ribosomal protein S18 acetylase RimI-like enzyme
MQEEIREITVAEIPQVIEVWAAAGLPTRPAGRDAPEALGRQLTRDPDLFLGAFVADRLVGVVIGTCDGRKGYVNRLAVRSGCRRRGLGDRLLSACEAALRRRGVEVFGALVELPNDASLGLFGSHGYHLHRDIVYLSRRDRPEA